MGKRQVRVDGIRLFAPALTDSSFAASERVREVSSLPMSTVLVYRARVSLALLPKK
jgi:hypothetical protein